MAEIVPDDIVKDMFGFAAPTEAQLSNISKWASRALELKAEIGEAEKYLKGLNAELAQIEEKDLPTAMLAAGTSEFILENGDKISISDVIQGGFTKDPDRRQFIFDWVVNQGGQEIIKDHFEVNYTRGEYNQAQALKFILQENKINFDEFENIHTQTFYAFLREKVREFTKTKEIVPFEKMGLRYFKRADIKPNKR